MIRTTKEIFITSESWHVDEARVRSEQGMTIVCLNFLVERLLRQQNIPYISLRDINSSGENSGARDAEIEEGKWWVLSHQISREWYRVPSMKFFEYRGIRIAEAPEPILQTYLARLFYYVQIYRALKKKYPDAHVTIPAPSLKNESDAYCLTDFISSATMDAARMVGLRHTALGARPAQGNYVFPRPTWKSFLIRIYNALVGIVPCRSFKIYSSEYWTHLAPVIPYLNDAELLLMESKKLFSISWRILLKHRIRVRYPHGEMHTSEARAIKQISENFVERWHIAKKEVAAYLTGVQNDLDWNPVLEACEYLIRYAPRVIADINVLYCIMEEERPDLVLQMASVGGPQHNFFLMARVAAQLKIPSVELQHAMATIDPRSVYSRIETNYLATYGADVNEWHTRIGHAPDRLISVGSPRFDQYVNEYSEGVRKGKQLFAKLGLDPSRPVLLAAVPFSDACVCMCTPDSYRLAEFFEVARAVQSAVSGLQVLFKFRGTTHVGVRREYVQELFTKDYAITWDEDLFSLLCASNAVVCNSSTVIYQTMLARKPLVLFPWKSFDSYHAQVYANTIPVTYTKKEAGEAIARIFTDVAYREELLARQHQFLKRYSFDGKSAERVAKLLRDLAFKKQH